MTSKRIFIIPLFTLLLFFAVPILASAETDWITFPSKANVDPQKSWKITLNMKIDPSTIHSKDIYAKSLDGKQLFLASYVSEDKKTITVLPPADGYEPGQVYSLFISKDIRSIDGVHMNKGYRLNFSVKQVIEDSHPVDSKVISFGTVTAPVLNVRSGKSTSTEKLGTVERGDIVKIYSFDGYWAEINYNGKTGYLHKDYLKLKKANGGILEGQIIVIDAGHGDQDPGAHANGLNEKDINLDVALRVNENLRKLGANSLLTRDDDTFLPLSGPGSRVEFTKENFGDLFVSIHTNADPSGGGMGAETYYDDVKSDNVYEGYLLAKNVQTQLLSMLGLYNRGVLSNNWRVITQNSVPSILVELGFITNDVDFAKLKSPDYHQVYADAITQGIVNYYKEEVR